MDKRITLLLPPAEASVSVATSAIEQAAELFRLDRRQALRAALAVEEIFLSLLRSGPRPKRIRLEVVPTATGMEVTFPFDPGSIDLGALNLAARGGSGDLVASGDLDRVGLLIAASSIDRLRVEMTEGGRVRLVIEQDRTYPEAQPAETAPFEAAGELRVERFPGPEAVREACLLALARHPVESLPISIQRPGRLVDMTSAGEGRCLLARDRRDRICGLLCWETFRGGSLFFDGPYPLAATRGEEIGKTLLEAFLQEIARSGARSVISFLGMGLDTGLGAGLPGGGFEQLGRHACLLPDGRGVERTAHFRMLAEDDGAEVYADETTRELLLREYDRLELIREILPAADTGEAGPESSLFNAWLDHRLSEAVLWPLLPGRDTAENIARHVQALRSRGFRNILCFMDLGRSWQARLAGPLAASGFRPLMLLPLAGPAGKSDLLLFQHETA